MTAENKSLYYIVKVKEKIKSLYYIVKVKEKIKSLYYIVKVKEKIIPLLSRDEALSSYPQLVLFNDVTTCCQVVSKVSI